MAIEKKKVMNIICECCDSEFILKFTKTTVNGVPLYCPFCSEALEDEQEDDFDDLDEETGEDENY